MRKTTLLLCLALSPTAYGGKLSVDLTLDSNFAPPDYAFYSYQPIPGGSENNIPVGPYIVDLNGSGYQNLYALAVCYDFNSPTYVGVPYSGTLTASAGTESLEATYLVDQLMALGGMSAPLAGRGALSLAIWEIMNASSASGLAQFPADPAAQFYEAAAAAAVSDGSWTAADAARYPTWVPDNPAIQRYAIILPGDPPAPEPAGLALMGLGLAFLAICGWGRRGRRPVRQR